MSQVEDLRSAAALLRDAATGDMPPGPWQMHKPVGLALADLLDSLGTMPSVSNTVDFHYALVVADAILAGGGS